MTPENVQHTFKEAIKSNDVDTIINTLQHPDMDLNCRDVTLDLQTPLMQLCHSSVDDQNITRDFLDVIASKQPELDLQDAVGRTLGMHACIALRCSILQFIMTLDYDVTICDRTGKNVFHYGASSGNDDIMDLLLQHSKTKAALRVLDLKGYSPLDLARQIKAQSIVKKISQTLNGNSNTASITRQPLKPVFKSSAGLKKWPAFSSGDGSLDSVAYKGASRMDSTEDAYFQNLENRHETVDHKDNCEIDSSAEDSSSGSCNNGKMKSINLTKSNGELFKPQHSLESPRLFPKSKLTRMHVKNDSLECFASNDTDNSDDFVTDDYGHDDYSADSSVEPVADNQYNSSRSLGLAEVRSHDRKPRTKLSKLDHKMTRLDNSSRRSPMNSNKISATDVITVPRSLAPLVSPRRKINLEMDLRDESLQFSSRSTSAEAALSNSIDKSKYKQLTSELKSDPRKPFRPTNFQNSNHVFQSKEKSSFTSRSGITDNFSDKTGDNRVLTKLNSLEAANLNAILSPQQPHKRLLFKRREIGGDTGKNPPEEESENKPTIDQNNGDEESLFEEEISLDSSQSSTGPSRQAQAQSRMQGRRPSLSLPDLRDMTGCLVTSRNESPSNEEDKNIQFLHLNTHTEKGDAKNKSLLQSSSDEDDDDDDEAVLEDEFSDECIEDCFNVEVERYTDLIKPRRSCKDSEENKGSSSDRPLPAINAPTSRKAKPVLKF